MSCCMTVIPHALKEYLNDFTGRHAHKDVSKGEKITISLRYLQQLLISSYLLFSLVRQAYVDIPLSLLLIRSEYLCLNTTSICLMALFFFPNLYDSSITLTVLPYTNDTECNAIASDKGANKIRLQMPLT